MKLDNLIAQRPTKNIYRDGNRTIKLFGGEYSAADVLNEALNHSIVEETGISVPKLHEVAKIDGKWAIISEFIEGVTLAWQLEDDPAGADKLIDRFTEIQLDIHSHSAERLRHHTDKMHDKIDKSGLDATSRYELHTRLAGLPRHSKLCHGDFVPDNVIITPDNSAFVLDWAHATQGNASADAARTYLRFKLEGSDARAEKYLDAFCKKSDTAKQYVQKWLAIVAASQLVKGKPEERELLQRWADVVEYE
jgi:aminoglycoside phosphotransferase (APT) family kinase protein